MADPQASKADQYRAHYAQLLPAGYSPNIGVGGSENRQADATAFIAYALGELVKEVRLLREAIDEQKPSP